MTTILVLKQVGSYLVKVAPWAWKQLPGNKPVAKAIASTHQRFSSRLPGLKAALESWIGSDEFRGQVTSIHDGTLTDSDLAHVECFVRVSGLSLGTGSLQNAGEALESFYTELYREFCSSGEGIRVVGAQLGAVHQDVTAVRQVVEDLSRAVEGLKNAPYRPPVEIDSTSKATTEIDRQAETELNFIKQLVDRRQAKTALTFLGNIQPRVESGAISSPIRLRFFLNKGVCHMLLGSMDDAVREFERAGTLDPANVKVLINLAQVSVLGQKYEAALAYVDSILANHAGDPNANALRFMCLHELDRGSEIAKVLSDHPALADDTHCLYTLAYIASDDERFDEAEYYLRRHNELDNKYPEAWELLGRVIVIPMQREILRTVASPNWISSALRERIEEAEVCFSKAEQLLVGAEVQQSLKFTLANRGVARTLLGRDDDARKDFERALAMYPEMEEFKRNLGNIYLASGKPEQAAPLFEAIQSPALKAEVLPFLAACYLEMNKPETVRDLLGPVAEVVTGGIRLFVQDLYLGACQRLKDLTCSR